MILKVLGRWCDRYTQFRWTVYRGSERFGTYFSWSEAIAVAYALSLRSDPQSRTK